MRKLSVGLLVALAVLALSAVIAANMGTTQASELQPVAPGAPEAMSDLKGNLAGEEKLPFIGIGVRTLPEDEAEELGVEGGAIVLRVLEGGPSAGMLHKADIILTVEGMTVTSAEDLLEKVRASEPCDDLSFTVMRGDESVTVVIKVGERPEHRTLRQPKPVPDLYHRLLSHLRQLGHKFVRAEIVLETDDGFKTFRAVKGTLSEIVVENGSFVLHPLDGSDEIPHEISDDTIVVTSHKGTLEGLNTTDKTLVVDVDGHVKLVHQGDEALGPRHPRPRFRPYGPGELRLQGPRNFRGFPEIRERLHQLLPAIPSDKPEGRSFDLRDLLNNPDFNPENLPERLQDLLDDLFANEQAVTQ